MVGKKKSRRITKKEEWWIRRNMKRKNKTKEGEEETKGIVNTISKMQDFKEIQEIKRNTTEKQKIQVNCNL